MTLKLLHEQSNIEEKLSFRWDEPNETALGHYLADYEWKFINQWLANNNQPKRILDVACGTGRLSKLLLQKNFDVVSMDVNATGLEIFKRHHPEAQLVMSDVHSTPFADRSFDCLVAVQCFEYFNSDLFISECARLLANQGILILQSLNRNNYRRFIRKVANFIYKRPLWDNEEKYCTKELIKTLEVNGFKIEAVTGYYCIPFNRHSKSKLVRPASFFERAFYLNRFHSLSPWVLICARKQT